MFLSLWPEAWLGYVLDGSLKLSMWFSFFIMIHKKSENSTRYCAKIIEMIVKKIINFGTSTIGTYYVDHRNLNFFELEEHHKKFGNLFPELLAR